MQWVFPRWVRYQYTHASHRIRRQSSEGLERQCKVSTISMAPTRGCVLHPLTSYKSLPQSTCVQRMLSSTTPPEFKASSQHLQQYFIHYLRYETCREYHTCPVHDLQNFRHERRTSLAIVSVFTNLMYSGKLDSQIAPCTGKISTLFQVLRWTMIFNPRSWKRTTFIALKLCKFWAFTGFPGVYEWSRT